MKRAVELAFITEHSKNKVYDDLYICTIIPKAKSLAEKGIDECEIKLKFNQENVEKYFDRLMFLLEQDGFNIVEFGQPSSWTRQDLYIKFSW